jgi:hypothetical protein
MFAIGLHGGDAPPTVAQYIFHSLFGLFFAFMAVWMIIALFSERQRSKLHWGKGRRGPPMSRFSILMALPFTLFVPARYIVYILAVAAGHEKTWTVPNWWFIPCVAIFLLGALYDDTSRRRRDGL